MYRRTLLAFIPLWVACSTPEPPSQVSSRHQSVEINDHPRLWLTQADVPRLRSWATSKNPMWRDAIAPLAER
ncbi:MAG: hypothetical protein JRH20_19610, partial [Deltaproteobacteria bacterium]|nr:hypothetical protein [Deltaproteobacteria bacterium]